jgi:hypothetical protein
MLLPTVDVLVDGKTNGDYRYPDPYHTKLFSWRWAGTVIRRVKTVVLEVTQQSICGFIIVWDTIYQLEQLFVVAVVEIYFAGNNYHTLVSMKLNSNQN